MTAEEIARRVDRLATRNRDAVRLARFVSFATVVEPALLRAARYRFVPRADAGTEADLWFSGLVQARSPHGIVLFSDIAESLRRGLTASDARAAFDLTSKVHANRARALRLEEEVNYLSLELHANRARVEALLSGAAAALVSGGRSEIANWAGRAVSRFPPAVQQLDATGMLAVASELRLGRGSTLRAHLEGHDAIPAWLAEVAPALPPVPIGVFMTDAGISFGPPAAGGPTLSAPSTNPVVLQLEWNDSTGSHARLVFVQPGTSTPYERMPAARLRITTLVGDTYTVNAAAGAKPTAVETTLTLRACPGAYRVLLKWFAPRPIPYCTGFAIERRTRDGRVDTLWRTDHVASSGPERRSTSEAPVQAFTWSDGGDPETEWPVQYRVVPVTGARAGLVRLTAQASNWSERVEPGPASFVPVSVSFNRALTFWGIGPGDKPGATPDADTDQIARTHLGGSLLASLIALLERTRTESGEVFVAITELSEPRVLDALAACGKRAHLILSWLSRPGYLYSNRDAFDRLRRAGVEVIADDRPTTRPSNNKFLVVANARGRPSGVWTGNAAWTPAGLLGRHNLALYLEDAEVASAFLSYWQRLKAVARGQQSRKALSIANAKPVVSALPNGEVRAWFTPAPDSSKHEVFNAIARARHGIIFVLGDVGSYDDVGSAFDEAQQRGVYVSGMLSRGMNVDILRDGRRARVAMTKSAFPAAALAALRRITPFPLPAPQIRAIVIDPFSDDPIVIAGSTGFASRAGRINDSNLVMVRGERALAIQCATTLEQIISNLDLNARLKQTPGRTLFNRGDDSWQQPFYASAERRRAMHFWTGVKAEAPANEPKRKHATARRDGSTRKRRTSAAKRPKRR